MSDLGIAAYSQSKFPDALACFQQVLAARMKLLGSDHPDTLRALRNTAMCLFHQQRLQEARQRLAEVFEGRVKALGEQNEDTIISAFELGMCLSDMGEHQQAEPLYRTVFEWRQCTFGSECNETATAEAMLASCLRDQGKLEESKHHISHVLAVRSATLGEGHILTLTSAASLAVVELRQHRVAEARESYSKVLGHLARHLMVDAALPLDACDILGQPVEEKKESVKAVDTVLVSGGASAISDGKPSILSLAKLGGLQPVIVAMYMQELATAFATSDGNGDIDDSGEVTPSGNHGCDDNLEKIAKKELESYLLQLPRANGEGSGTENGRKYGSALPPSTPQRQYRYSARITSTATRERHETIGRM